MMFNNKFVVAVKYDNKVLREFKDTVMVPFGSEYTIYLKNLNSVRAQVRITIDGQDVADGDTYIVNANSDFELSRFMKNGNLKSGNRFKFIERTGSVEQHRGVGVEDGLIRVEFQFEKLLPKTKTEQELLMEKLDQIKKDLDRKADKSDIPYPWRYYPPYWDRPYCGSPSPSPLWTTYSSSDSLSGQAVGSAGLNQNNASLDVDLYCANVSQSNVLRKDIASTNVITTASANDIGVTVPGSISEQQFVTVSSFPLEDTVHVMVLKMVGETETGKVVKKPVLVTSKPKCTSCGRVNKSNAKFCQECGTSLEII